MTLLARLYLRAYRATAIGLAVLTALVLAAIPYLLSLDTQAATAWTSPWASVAQVQADWQAVGAPCYSVTTGKLTMQCQSAGLVTRAAWSPLFPLTVTARVSATAVTGGKYFAGLTIYDHASDDTRYGELALGRNVPPMSRFGDSHYLMNLVDDGGYTPYQTVQPSTAYTLSVVYRPGGIWDGARYWFYLNGALQSYRDGQALGELRIFLVCASVGEATPNDGSLARCEFGPVAVTGVPSAEVRAVYLPLVERRQPTPKAYP